MEPAMLMASYAAWRMTYQDAEQAAKAAYFKAHEHAMKLDAKDAEIAALKAEVAEWKRVASAQASLHDESATERDALKAKLDAARAMLRESRHAGCREWMDRVAAFGSEPSRCEGCSEEAAHFDIDGVPLCCECWHHEEIAAIDGKEKQDG